jgi:4-hydroxy-tetrahydrodipicolinate reductase
VSEPLKIIIHGAAGRMGQRLIQLLVEDPALTLAAAIDRADHPALGTDAGVLAGTGSLGVPLQAEYSGPADAAIDFSLPAASLPFASFCAGKKIPLVVGTTGFEPDQRHELERLSQQIPLLVSANFSKAVNLLMHLSAEAARVLGSTADIEIVERHHRFKKDAPSGTALRLAEVITQQLGASRLVHGREGVTGERPQGDIGMHALRTGDNPGEHTVVFGLMGECLELSHRALNRDGFVRGALDASKFLAGKPAGRYTMAHMLGF